MIRSSWLPFLTGALARRLIAADDKATKPLFAAGNPPIAVPAAPLSQEDDAFLDELEKANYLFFEEQAHPETGLVKDRCNTRATDTSVVASIAGTGFGLTALCIAHQRGWVSLPDARDRAITTLRFLWEKMPTHRGFFFHWANVVTGERIWDAEVSSIDTAILACSRAGSIFVISKSVA